MKRILPVLLAFALPAAAERTYDKDAQTLTSADGTNVLNNVYLCANNQKWLVVGDNGNRSDITVLDFSDPVADVWMIRSLAGKNGDSKKDSAFDGCPNLTTVITGDYPLDLGERAFENCDALATVNIGKGCTSIGRGTFRNCDGPMVVTFAEGSAPTSIGQNAFNNAKGLLRVDLSNCPSFATLNNGAFTGCSSLKTVIFPQDCQITSIAEKPFHGCTSLETLDLSVCTRLETIATKAFLNNAKLSRVDLPASLASLPIQAFDKHLSLAEGTEMLHVWFRSCPIEDAKNNPFAEMFGSTKDYTVTDADLANASVTIHIPRAQATAGTPN